GFWWRFLGSAGVFVGIPAPVAFVGWVVAKCIGTLKAFVSSVRANAGDKITVADALLLIGGEPLINRSYYLRLFLFGLLLTFSLLSQSDRVPAGTEVRVRTNERIEAGSPSDFRIYSASIDNDVRDRAGQVVIPRGSQAELILRNADANNVVLDLESITVNGE